MKLVFSFLLLAATLGATTVNCTNNASTDPSAVRTAVAGGGTVTISGTCNFSSSQVTISNAVSIVGASGASINGNNAAYNGGPYAFTIQADSVSITSLTFNNGIGPAYLAGAIRRHFVFDYNLVENTGLLNSALQVAGILSYADISSNNWLNIGPTGIEGFTINTWPTIGGSGGIGIPGTPNCYSTGSCDPPSGIGILIYGGIDNTTIQFNTADYVAADWIHLQMDGLANNAVWTTPATNDSISYNRLTHGHRYMLELQGAFSGCTFGTAAGDCDITRYWFTGFKVNGNYWSTPAAGVYYNTWGFSVVMDFGTGTFENNTAMNETGNQVTSGNYNEAGEAFESGWNTVTNQGNVATGTSYGLYCSTCNNGGPTYLGAWGSGFSFQINTIGVAGGLYTTQNNVFCNVASNFTQEPPQPGTYYVKTQYNYINNSYLTSTPNTCPGGTNPNTSNLALTLASSSASGSNLTWNYAATDNLSIRWVQYFLDGSTTPLATQEQQDLNTNFANDLKWLYHETLNTATLSPGAHTLSAVATDVSGATKTVAQNFTVGSGTVSNQTITFTGLPATAVYGSAGPYTLNGTASSGLTVSYAVTGPATLSGSTLTITGPGTVSVTASQGGNGSYYAATPVTQTIVVSAQAQTITFTGLPSTATYGAAGPYSLNGTATSGLPVTYAVSGPATLSTGTSGTTVSSAAYTLSVSGDAPASDDFTASSLNTSLWTVVAPAGGTVTASSGSANLAAPAGSNHDAGGPNDAVQILQTVSNTDFAVAAKFDSIPNAIYQGEGILVQQDANTYIRFEVGYEGSGTIGIFANSIASGSQTLQDLSSLTILPTSLWIEVQRTGNLWTLSYSADGVTFTPVGSPFTLALTVAKIGPYADNYGSPASNAPAFTAVVDAFHNVSSTSAGTLTFTPASGTIFATGMTVALTSSVNGATIYYTTDGSTPTTSSSVYSAPISISATTTIKALAPSLSGSTLTITGPGTVSVTASQAGNNTYAAATPVTQTIAVSSPTGAPSVSPSTLSFGSVTLGSNTSSTVTLTNSGGAAVSFLGATLTGTNPGDFMADGTACGSSVAANSSCTITVTFTPAAAGARAGTLNVATGTGTLPVSLGGTGASSGALSVSCAPASCSAGPGQTVTLTATSPTTFCMPSGTVGSLSTSCGASVTTAVYTAPGIGTMDEARHSVGGCMVLPNDAVYNTPIAALPVNAASANWIAALGASPIYPVPSWDVNVIDSTVPTITNPLYYYTNAYDSIPIQIPNDPNRKRENGAMANGSGPFEGDHHIVSVRHDICNWIETYHDYIPAGGLSMGQTLGGGCTNGGAYAGCTANSSWQYLSTSYALPTDGASAAGSQPIEPTTANADEVNAGAITHALRLTTNNGGCSSSYLWPAGGGNGNCGGSGAIPMGGRIRMKAAATCPYGSGQGVIYCTALKTYGAIEDDITAGPPQLTIGINIYYDASTRTFAVGGMGFPESLFEGVDESSLMISANSYAVNPGNGYVTPSNSALVNINGGAIKLSIALTPITVGVTEEYEAMPSGQTYTPSAWVNGTTTTTVNWTATGGGSFSNGVYTAPTVSPGGNVPVTLKACSTIDSNACAHINMIVLPSTCKNSDTTLRVCIDVGGTTSYGPDANGDTWSPDATPTGGIYKVTSNNHGWSTQTDGQLYYTIIGKGSGSGDIYYHFVGMPQGNYKITYLQGIGDLGQGQTQCNPYNGWPSTYYAIPYGQLSTSGPLYLPSILGAQDVITNAFYDAGRTFPTNDGYQCFTRSQVSVPAMVGSNGLLTTAMLSFSDAYFPYNPNLAAMKIEADSTPAHLAIDLGGSTDTVRPGGTVQLYPQWWYLPVGTATWSILSGPTGATISNTGLFTAPSTLAVTMPAIVQVSDGQGHTATLPLYVQGSAAIGAVY